jgi:hypothetical protein
MMINNVDELNLLIQKCKEQGIIETNQVSDGFHTFQEIYTFRMMYNAALFNEWHSQGKYQVHKSLRHHEGELCFGGGWFVVAAMLPSGQITNHYPESQWDFFKILETKNALFPFDGHTPTNVLERIATL